MTLTAVCVVWICLSITVSAAFWFSLLEPFWFINTSTATSIGVYSYCVIAADHTSADVTSGSMTSSVIATSIARLFAGSMSPTGDDGLVCRLYGDRFQLDYMPSGPWQAACLLLTAGAVLMSLSALLSVATLCVPRHRDTGLAVVIGYIQIVAGMSSISLVLYLVLDL